MGTTEESFIVPKPKDTEIRSCRKRHSASNQPQIVSLKSHPSVFDEVDATRLPKPCIRSRRLISHGSEMKPSKVPAQRLEHDRCFVDDIILCNLVPELHPLRFQVCQIQKLNGMGFLADETVLDLEIPRP